MVINLMSKALEINGVYLPESGSVAQAAEIYQTTGEYIDGMPVYTKISEYYWDIPTPKEGVWYLISNYVYVVARRLGRVDVITVYNGKTKKASSRPIDQILGVIKD